MTATRSLSVTISATIINTGFAAPSANAPVTSGTGDNNGSQTDPTNAYVLDGIPARGHQQRQHCEHILHGRRQGQTYLFNYDLNVPTGATVMGIEVRLNVRADNTSGSPRTCVQFSWDVGSTWTTAQNTNTLTTTIAQFGNSLFRVRIINAASSTSRTFSLDAVAVRVTYQ